MVDDLPLSSLAQGSLRINGRIIFFKKGWGLILQRGQEKKWNSRESWPKGSLRLHFLPTSIPTLRAWSCHRESKATPEHYPLVKLASGFGRHIFQRYIINRAHNSGPWGNFQINVHHFYRSVILWGEKALRKDNLGFALLNQHSEIKRLVYFSTEKCLYSEYLLFFLNYWFLNYAKCLTCCTMGHFF